MNEMQGGQATKSSDTNSADFLSTRARIRLNDLLEAKRREEKWAMLTSYDATSARIFDLAKIPVLLVGDSAAQAVLGLKSTIPITMDEMVPLARAVVSSCQRAMVIGDMPFGSYQESPQLALRNATRFMKEAQVHGVKMEGGAEIVRHVELLASSGIPVMGHVGLTPQAEHALSGYKVQARGAAAKDALLRDALALQGAGAFACVVELVPSDVGASLQSTLDIPVIGIGAGPATDAQVLVWTDMAGFSAPKGASGAGYLAGAAEGPSAQRLAAAGGVAGGETPPRRAADSERPERARLELARAAKFVKRYANISEILFEAALSFANDVRSGRYPGEEHCYE